MKRKCSMCGEYKDTTQFRYMNTLKRYNCYCKECEKWYMKQYGRIRYERERARRLANAKS